MLARVMPGPSGNEAETFHLRSLTQTIGQVVFPITSTADNQAAFMAAEPTALSLPEQLFISLDFLLQLQA